MTNDERLATLPPSGHSSLLIFSSSVSTSSSSSPSSCSRCCPPTCLPALVQPLSLALSMHFALIRREHGRLYYRRALAGVVQGEGRHSDWEPRRREESGRALLAATLSRMSETARGKRMGDEDGESGEGGTLACLRLRASPMSKTPESVHAIYKLHINTRISSAVMPCLHDTSSTPDHV